MKKFLLFLSTMMISQGAYAQCYQNGVPCTSQNTPPTTQGDPNSGSPPSNSPMNNGSVSLNSGTNTVGSVNVNGTIPVTGTFYQSIQPVSQSSNWITSLIGTLPDFASPPTVNLGTTGNLALDSSVNTLFKAGQTIGNTGFGITGTLPDFTHVPTVNLGTLNGAATSGKQDQILSILTTIGTPLQNGGSIANTAFGINGTLPGFAVTPTFNLGPVLLLLQIFKVALLQHLPPTPTTVWLH